MNDPADSRPRRAADDSRSEEGPERWLPRDQREARTAQRAHAADRGHEAELGKTVLDGPRSSGSDAVAPSTPVTNLRLSRRGGIGMRRLGMRVPVPLWCLIAVPSLLIGMVVSPSAHGRLNGLARRAVVWTKR